MNKPQTTTRKGIPLLGIAFSILFTALGLYLIFNVAEQPNTTNRALIRTIGVGVTIFFSGLLLLVLVKLLKRR